jgi:cell division protein ZapD
MSRETALDHHFALVTLFEIMDVSSRADLKSDLLKELEKHKAQFISYRGNPAIDEARLDEVVARIDGAFQRLNAWPARPVRR